MKAKIILAKVIILLMSFLILQILLGQILILESMRSIILYPNDRDEKLPIFDDYFRNNFQINENFENLRGKFLLIGGDQDLMTPSKNYFHNLQV